LNVEDKSVSVVVSKWEIKNNLCFLPMLVTLFFTFKMFVDS
jgi:hypothetical protein